MKLRKKDLRFLFWNSKESRLVPSDDVADKGPKHAPLHNPIQTKPPEQTNKQNKKLHQSEHNESENLCKDPNAKNKKKKKREKKILVLPPQAKLPVLILVPPLKILSLLYPALPSLRILGRYYYCCHYYEYYYYYCYCRYCSTTTTALL